MNGNKAWWAIGDWEEMEERMQLLSMSTFLLIEIATKTLTFSNRKYHQQFFLLQVDFYHLIDERTFNTAFIQAFKILTKTIEE